MSLGAFDKGRTSPVKPIVKTHTAEEMIAFDEEGFPIPVKTLLKTHTAEEVLASNHLDASVLSNLLVLVSARQVPRLGRESAMRRLPLELVRMVAATVRVVDRDGEKFAEARAAFRASYADSDRARARISQLLAQFSHMAFSGLANVAMETLQGEAQPPARRVGGYVKPRRRGRRRR